MADTFTSRLALIKQAGGDVIQVDKINSNFDDIDENLGAFVCTSASRPATPYVGQLIYETDTECFRVRSATEWLLAYKELPDPTLDIVGTNTIVAAAFAALPTAPINREITLPFDCWVQIDFGGWISKATAAQELRVGVELSGATVRAPGGSGVNDSGSVIFASTYSYAGQKAASFIHKLEAGTTNIDVRAYVSTGSAGFNYARLQVTPLRWAE